MSSRALVVAGLILAIVVGAGGVVYAFGTPTAPSEPTMQAAAAVEPEAAASGEPVEAVAAGAAPSSDEPVEQELVPPDPDSPLAIEIPGCVCHSDDPELVEQHAEYRMNQCAGCHAGQVPTGTQ